MKSYPATYNPLKRLVMIKNKQDFIATWDLRYFNVISPLFWVILSIQEETILSYLLFPFFFFKLSTNLH